MSFATLMKKYIDELAEEVKKGMAQKDGNFGLAELLEETLSCCEEIIEKYGKTITKQEKDDIDELADCLDEMLEKYEEQGTEQAPEKAEVIDVEVIK